MDNLRRQGHASSQKGVPVLAVPDTFSSRSEYDAVSTSSKKDTLATTIIETLVKDSAASYSHLANVNFNVGLCHTTATITRDWKPGIQFQYSFIPSTLLIRL